MISRRGWSHARAEEYSDARGNRDPKLDCVKVTTHAAQASKHEGRWPDEPSPCLSTATSVWYELHPARSGRLVLDLAGSTPLDPVVRLYRRTGHSSSLTFIGCASPVWNAQLSLEVPVSEGETVLAQVGTSESLEGRLVVRAGLRD